MKLTKNKNQITLIFSEFLDGIINDETLISELIIIQDKFICEKKINTNELWFKFSNDDTLATTINDIKCDLTSKNRDFLIERFKMCIENDSLLMFFS